MGYSPQGHKELDTTERARKPFSSSSEGHKPRTVLQADVKVGAWPGPLQGPSLLFQPPELHCLPSVAFAASCSFEASSTTWTFSITSSLSVVSPPPASLCCRPVSSRLHFPTPSLPRMAFLPQDPQLNPICKVPVAT